MFLLSNIQAIVAMFVIAELTDASDDVVRYIWSQEEALVHVTALPWF